MRRFLIISVLLLSGFTQASLAKHVTLHGYVTAVHSPLSFEMGEYKILDRTEEERERIKNEGRDYRPPQLKPGMLRVGLEVEVKGEYNRASGEVKATSIKAINDDSNPDKSVAGMGLVEDKATLQKNGKEWSGRFKADGEMLVLTADTQISLKRSRKERKERENLGLEADDVASFSPDQIDAQTFACYEGVRQADHSILAKKIEFQQDRAGSESDWSSLEPRVVYEGSHYDSGTLRIGEKEYELFPSPEASTYLETLGKSLIPAHQRKLPDNNPGKVRFRFFLIKSDLFAIDVYPNGVVVISAHVFDLLDNEAQLAFVLGREVAKAAEKQQWTASKYHENQRKEAEAAGLASTLIVPGGPLIGLMIDNSIAHKFERSLQNQADRVGVEYMLAAGYDPNQAIDCWNALEKKRAHGPFWGDSNENLMRRTYLQSELQLDYANRDFSNLKRDSAEFHAASDAVKAARLRVKSKKK